MATSRKRVSVLGVTLLVGALFAAGTLGGQAAGESRHVRATFAYLIATDFLCDLDPTACPAISTASNGDVIEVTGMGTFTVAPKSVTGAGTFLHKNAASEVVASGTWSAVQLLSFQSFGSGAAQGLPPETWGGRLLIRVLMEPEGATLTQFGILRVTCLLGNKIPSGSDEGTRLSVQGGTNFNKELSGATIFVRA